jgi:glycosyltransferase involved in cell wall biosynthesis
MPNVVLEAMASGRPLVATDVEGVRELLGPLAARQVVRYGDTRELADTIIALVSDAAGATALGVENRRRAEEHFPISRTILAYEDLWTSLVAG